MNNAPASCGAEGRKVRRSNSPARTNSPLGCSARAELAADLSALGSSTAEVAQPCVPAIELREVSFSYGKEPFIGGLSAMFSHGAV
ncbi:MAG: ABC transporter ATP-binding protein, partial [Eggerthellaceae bacterium]